MSNWKDDGMQHEYQTCPTCERIVSSGNIVLLDGRKMCRTCLRARMMEKDAASRFKAS